MNATLLATNKQIETILERLYQATREINASQSERPVFVLVSTGPEQRSVLENSFFAYFARRYGIEGLELYRIAEREYTKNFTRLEFGEYGFSILLMDW